MKAVYPDTAHAFWKWFKVQKICKRDTYKPWTFNKPKYAVMVDLYYPEYGLNDWTYIWLGTIDEPTTYDTAEEAKEFMEWIKAWCDTADNVEDVF